MGTISIAIIVGLAGLVVGFILACWLSSTSYREQEAEISTLRKDNAALKAVNASLRRTTNAAKDRVNALHRENDALYRQVR